jgi:hypothetical protein
VDLTSYFLEMNGFQAGAATMNPDQAALDAVPLASIRSE